MSAEVGAFLRNAYAHRSSVAPRVDDDEADPPPGILRWLIACDESGIEGRSDFYGFGTLWMRWQRRGDFHEEIRDIRRRHGFEQEIKWTNVRPYSLAFYRDLVQWFFKTPWVCFHCLVVPKALVDRKRHDNDMDLARRKHFTMLLTNKIRRSLRAHPSRQQTFRIWVDPIASRYGKADEAVAVIANNVLAKVFDGRRSVDKVITRDSKETLQIQICDLLLGAVLASWREEATAPVKDALQKWIAAHLTWSDLKADTPHLEKKFNIWMFHEPPAGVARLATTRPVRLMYPLPKSSLRGAAHVRRTSR